MTPQTLVQGTFAALLLIMFALLVFFLVRYLFGKSSKESQPLFNRIQKKVDTSKEVVALREKISVCRANGMTCTADRLEGELQKMEQPQFEKIRYSPSKLRKEMKGLKKTGQAK